MARLEVESGKSIYYEDYAGEGRPIVLIHGWGMSCRAFDYNLAALRGAGHRVLAIDHRACGHSDKDFDDVSISAIAGDIAKLVRDRDAKGAVLIGWSLGAASTVEAADMLGDDVAGMVLIGSPSPRYMQGDGWEFGATEEALEESKVGLTTARADTLWAISQGVCKTMPSDQVLNWMWNIFMETSPNADQSLIALGDVDHRDKLPNMNVPTLLTVGAADVIVDPRTSHAAGDLLPNATVSVYEESGHAPFLEEQAKWEAEVLAFVAGL
jgi:non-heme chloroperoxidase